MTPSAYWTPWPTARAEDRWEPWPISVEHGGGPDRTYDNHPDPEVPAARPVRGFAWTTHIDRVMPLDDATETEPLLWEGDQA